MLATANGEEMADAFNTSVTARTTIVNNTTANDSSPKEEAEKEELLNGQAQSLMRRIEQLLSFRTAIVFDYGFPFNRRFQRLEIWRLEREDFTDQELEMGEGYNDALDRLVKDGLVQLVEVGGKSKYDIFQVVPV